MTAEILNAWECLVATSEAGRIGAELSGQVRQITRTCYHEASHAVVQLSFGLPAKIIISNEGGLCDYSQELDFATPIDECPDDEQQTAIIIKRSPDPIDLDRVRQETAKILKTHWSLVEAIAASLESRIIRNGEKFSARITRGELAMMWKLHKEGGAA